MRFQETFDFSGRAILVIGARRGGIGTAIAAAFTECGATVRITGAELEPIESERERYPYTQLDITDAPAVQRLAQATPELHVLVNCWRGGASQATARGRSCSLPLRKRGV